MVFEDVIEDCVRIAGSGKALANELGVTPQEITRIRSLDSKISIQTINKMISFSGLLITPAGKERNLKIALKIMSDLFIEADNKIDQQLT